MCSGFKHSLYAILPYVRIKTVFFISASTLQRLSKIT